MSISSAWHKSGKANRLVPCLLAASVSVILSGSFNLVLADDAAAVSANLLKLEDKYFQHDFSKDEVGERIERLEKLVFGEVRTGSNDERMKTLMQLVPNWSSKAPDSENATPNANANPNNKTSDSSQTDAPPSAPEQRKHNYAPTKASRPALSTQAPISDNGADPDEQITNDNSYPAVTAMEKKLLGRDYVGESVGKRLDRLEIKAYGKTSASDDLQERVDRLKTSSGVDVAKTRPPNSEWADEEEEDPLVAGSHGVTPFTGIVPDDPSSQRSYRKQQQQNAYRRSQPSYDPYAGTGSFGAGNGSFGAGGGGLAQSNGGAGGSFGSGSGGSAMGGLPTAAPDYSHANQLAPGGPTTQLPAPTMGVSQQISLLEREVFKKSYDKETILSRLSRLETTVFPQDKPASDKSLPERMNRLLAAVPISQASTEPQTQSQSKQKRRGVDPDFPDLDFDSPTLASQMQAAQAQAQRANSSTSGGGGGLSKLINGLGSALGGGYTTNYPTPAGHLATDPSTGLLIDQYTGTLIDPMTGAVVGRRQVQMGGYPAYGGFNSGMSPYGGMGGAGMSPYGGVGGVSPFGGMGGVGGMGSGMGFGFGGGGMRMGGWP